MARPLVAQGRIEEVVHLAVVAQHLITFTRECLAGTVEAWLYADPARGVARRAAGAA